MQWPDFSQVRGTRLVPDFRDHISLAHGRVTVQADAVTLIYSGPRGFLDRRAQSPLTRGTSGLGLILQDIPVLPSRAGGKGTGKWGVGSPVLSRPALFVSLSTPLSLFHYPR